MTNKAETKYGQLYAITVTMNPKVFVNDINTQKKLLQQAIGNLTNIIKISLICELTKSFNVHAHGVIQIQMDNTTTRSPKQRIANLFRMLSNVGFVAIKDLDNDVGWRDYCQKSYDDNLLEFEYDDPIIFDQCAFFNVTPFSV